MEYAFLGHSGLKVSRVTLGTMTFGGKDRFGLVGNSGVDEATEIVNAAIDGGVNLFDTADVYSMGASEEILGRALGSKRDQVLIASKVRFPVGSGPNDVGLSRLHVIQACEASLRRLGTDRIDLYQLHEWDGVTPLEETISALDTLVNQGKVRYVGCSNYAAWQLMKALGVSERLGLSRFVSQQIYYSLLNREAEYELVPLSVDQGLGILVWSPLAGGLLSGKYRRGHAWPTDARQTQGWGEPPVHDWERTYDIIEKLIDVSSSMGEPPARVALAWLLSRPGVTSLVIGARKLSQLRENLAAMDLVLGESELAELNSISEPELLYPYWHQKNFAVDRLSEADRTLLDR